MVTTQEIIERSLYASLMQVALQLGKTINPELYLPVTVENQKRYQAAMDAIGDEFIYIFGVGNNQVRGPKIVPRITIDLNAYYPGNIGVEAFMVGDEIENNEYRQYSYPFETQLNRNRVDVEVTGTFKQGGSNAQITLSCPVEDLRTGYYNLVAKNWDGSTSRFLCLVKKPFDNDYTKEIKKLKTKFNKFFNRLNPF